MRPCGLNIYISFQSFICVFLWPCWFSGKINETVVVILFKKNVDEIKLIGVISSRQTDCVSHPDVYKRQEGVSGTELHRRLSTQYGDNILLKRTVYEWIKTFKKGRTSAKNEDRSGRPTSSTTDDIIEEVNKNIRRVTVDEVAYHLQISHGRDWKHPESLLKNKFKSQSSAGNITLTDSGSHKSHTTTAHGGGLNSKSKSQWDAV